MSKHIMVAACGLCPLLRGDKRIDQWCKASEGLTISITITDTVEIHPDCPLPDLPEEN